jgi:hypothetical protein
MKGVAGRYRLTAAAGSRGEEQRHARDPRACSDVRHFSSVEGDEIRGRLDDGKYAYSWYENAEDGAHAEASVDGEGDASGAGLTSHF